MRQDVNTTRSAPQQVHSSLHYAILIILCLLIGLHALG